jgi:hypothetical protein
MQGINYEEHRNNSICSLVGDLINKKGITKLHSKLPQKGSRACK